MAVMMTISIIISLINIILILLLLYVYGKNFVRMRSGFTAGLFIFGLLFLIHNILYLYFIISMMSYYSENAQIFGFVFNLLQAFAFFVLNIITWK
ncbi:hypothetical protein HYV50_02710 [Candidatus Pacearchaeota archaeon]|nr:hypothetical protein [Candidatus Pacearchaeota archaeon]